MGSAWPCLRSGSLQHMLSQRCCCNQTRDAAFANLLLGVMGRLLSDSDGRLTVLSEDLETLEEEKIKPFWLSTTLIALCENAAFEFVDNLNVTLVDLKYSEEEVKIITLNIRYTSSNCLDANCLPMVDHLGGRDSNVSDAEEDAEEYRSAQSESLNDTAKALVDKLVKMKVGESKVSTENIELNEEVILTGDESPEEGESDLSRGIQKVKAKASKRKNSGKATPTVPHIFRRNLLVRNLPKKDYTG